MCVCVRVVGVPRPRARALYSHTLIGSGHSILISFRNGSRGAIVASAAAAAVPAACFLRELLCSV